MADQKRRMPTEVRQAIKGVVIVVLFLSVALAIAYGYTAVKGYVYRGSTIERLDRIEKKLDELLERNK